VHGHIPSLAFIIAIGKQLAHEILERKAALLEDASLSVLSKNYIVRCQCCCRTDGNSFFSGRNLSDISTLFG
jgi:hypothetical protein